MANTYKTEEEKLVSSEAAELEALLAVGMPQQSSYDGSYKGTNQEDYKVDHHEEYTIGSHDEEYKIVGEDGQGEPTYNYSGIAGSQGEVHSRSTMSEDYSSSITEAHSGRTQGQPNYGAIDDTYGLYDAGQRVVETRMSDERVTVPQLKSRKESDDG
jgi:hypothetical protein